MHLRSTFFSIFTMVFLTFSLDVFSSERRTLRGRCLGQKTAREEAIEFPDRSLEEECDATICKKSPKSMRRQGAYADLSRIMIVPPTPSPMAPLPWTMVVADEIVRDIFSSSCSTDEPSPASVQRTRGKSPLFLPLLLTAGVDKATIGSRENSPEPRNPANAITIENKEKAIDAILCELGISLAELSQEIEKQSRLKERQETCLRQILSEREEGIYRYFKKFLPENNTVRVFQQKAPHPSLAEDCPIATVDSGALLEVHIYPSFHNLEIREQIFKMQLAVQGVLLGHEKLFRALNSFFFDDPKKESVAFLMEKLSLAMTEEARINAMSADFRVKRRYS